MAKIFAQVILYNSVTTHGVSAIERSLRALCEQSGYSCGEELFVSCVDNNSSDESLECVQAACTDLPINWDRSEVNLGFSGAANLGAQRFLESECDFFMLVNADLRLEKEAVERLVRGFENGIRIGVVCPCLLRADESLEPVVPEIVDAAGMYMTLALRHFDRNSGKVLDESVRKDCDVFGGSGACLLMSREFVEDVALRGDRYDSELTKIYPGLGPGRLQRHPLFDEAFLAYREDADLAWRAQLLGWRCRYVASAIGYHKRVVLPDRRKELSPQLNLLGVRNRFLLQFNNMTKRVLFTTFLDGIILRNFLVIVGVFLREQSSLLGLYQAIVLFRRARERRRMLLQRTTSSDQDRVVRWFKKTPFTEDSP